MEINDEYAKILFQNENSRRTPATDTSKYDGNPNC